MYGFITIFPAIGNHHPRNPLSEIIAYCNVDCHRYFSLGKGVKYISLSNSFHSAWFGIYQPFGYTHNNGREKRFIGEAIFNLH